LFWLIDWIMDLPKPLEGLFVTEIRVFEEEKQMPYVTSAERLGREAGLEEGLRQGLQKGRQEGLMAGIELGLKLKFGADGLKLLPEIRQIADFELLRKVHQSIETATSPEVLRKVWSPA